MSSFVVGSPLTRRTDTFAHIYETELADLPSPGTSLPAGPSLAGNRVPGLDDADLDPRIASRRDTKAPAGSVGPDAEASSPSSGSPEDAHLDKARGTRGQRLCGIPLLVLLGILSALVSVGGVIIIWHSWRGPEDFHIHSAVEEFSLELVQRVQGVTELKLKLAPLSLRLNRATLVSGDFDLDNAQWESQYDGQLVRTLQLMQRRSSLIRSLIVALDDGKYLAAVTNAQNVYEIYAKELHANGALTNCLVRYSVNPVTKARDMGSATSVDCAFDAQNLDWVSQSDAINATWSSLGPHAHDSATSGFLLAQELHGAMIGGVLAVEVSLAYLDLSSTQMPEHGVALVVDAAGGSVLLAHADPSMPSSTVAKTTQDALDYLTGRFGSLAGVKELMKPHIGATQDILSAAPVSIPQYGPGRELYAGAGSRALPLVVVVSYEESDLLERVIISDILTLSVVWILALVLAGTTFALTAGTTYHSRLLWCAKRCQRCPRLQPPVVRKDDGSMPSRLRQEQLASLISDTEATYQERLRRRDALVTASFATTRAKVQYSAVRGEFARQAMDDRGWKHMESFSDLAKDADAAGALAPAPAAANASAAAAAAPGDLLSVPESAAPTSRNRAPTFMTASSVPEKLQAAADLVREALANEQHSQREYLKAKALQVERQRELEAKVNKGTSIVRNAPQITFWSLVVVVLLWFALLLRPDPSVELFIRRNVEISAARVIDQAQAWVSFAQLANEFALLRFERLFPHESTPASAVHLDASQDVFFVEVMDAFRNDLALGNELAPPEPGEEAEAHALDASGLQFSAMYAGLANNEFRGAMRVANTKFPAVSPVEVGVVLADNSTDQCQLLRAANGTAYGVNRCCYDPVESSWYLAAASGVHNPERDFVWSPLYRYYTSGALGFTAAAPYPFRVPDAPVRGVFGVDLNVVEISKFLASFQVRISPGFRVWIMDDSGLFLAANEHDVSETRLARGIRAMEVDDEVVAATSKFLFHQSQPQFETDSASEIAEAERRELTDAELLSGVPATPTLVDRDVFSPVTWIASVDPTAGLNWLVVAAYPEDDLFAKLDADRRAATTLEVAAIVLVLWLLFILIKLPERGPEHLEEAKEAKSFQEMYKNDDMVRWTSRNRIKRAVIAAYETLRPRAADGGEPAPIVRDTWRVVRAKFHYLERDNVLTTCALEVGGHTTFLAVYRALRSPAWDAFMVVVNMLHIGTALWEPIHDRGSTSGSVIAVIFFCLTFEFVHILSRLLERGLAGWNHLMGSSRDLVDRALLLLWLLAFGDWLMIVSGPRKTILLLLFRPILIVVMNERVRITTHTFYRSLVSQRTLKVFVLYGLTVVVAAVSGLVLFRRIQTFETALGNFENVVNAIITSFIFISQGENYADLVFEAIAEHPLYIAWFIFFTILGSFVILSMIIDRFQQGFEDENANRQTKLDNFAESKAIAAHTLLTYGNDERELLSEDQFAQFMNKVEPDASDKQIRWLYQQLDDLDPLSVNEGLLEDEFVRGVNEVLEFDRYFLSRRAASSMYKSALRMRLHAFLKKPTYFFLLVLVNFAEVVTLALYGSYDDGKLLDVLMLAFLVFQVGEMALKVGAWGWERFWFHDRFYQPRDYRQLVNRFDFVIVIGAFTLTVVTRIAAGESILWLPEGQDDLRFPLSLPIFRLFTLLLPVRKLIFSMVSVLSQFVSLFVLLMVFFFVYGVVGVELFDGVLEKVDEEATSDASFNSLGAAFTTLFQMLVGEAWHDIMYQHVLGTRFWAAGYFISWIIIVTLFFSNLFIGLILSSQQDREEKSGGGKGDSEDLIMSTLFASGSAGGAEGASEDGSETRADDSPVPGAGLDPTGLESLDADLDRAFQTLRRRAAVAPQAAGSTSAVSSAV